MTLSIIPVPGIGEVQPGADLAEVILEAIDDSGIGLEDDDVVVVTHKVVSKAEAATARYASDAEYQALKEQEATAVIRRRGNLMIAMTRQGFICANAGVDRSNVEPGQVALHPRDPDLSAHRLRIRFERASRKRLAVIITDTFGRPWRRGLTDVAIGLSGMPAIHDYRGTTDTWGNELEVTEVALVDEIAAAADLVMGKADRIPVAIIRGLSWPEGEGRATDLVRPPGEDLFR
ncbi:coenzyme F420:L-glutamate ligase [bacterium BMS3Abin02]|nr:coenzyme F420:L-glutamate ligase [bacterium BMS3Abin02]GBE21785.1 coenzyme F420:L-glutamate ligase [bacterium BMS3Bbin01]